MDSVIIKCVDGIAKHMAQNTAEAAGLNMYGLPESRNIN